MTYINKQWLLDQRPKGMPGDECWKLNEEEVRPLEKGEVLIKILYLSIDPYMRGRMNDGESYAEPAALGEPMTGESVGVVVESESDKYIKGDYLCVHKGWQTYIIASDEEPALFKADPSIVPLQTYLGPVGMPGRTAYCGLLRVGLPKSGETIVVSAASGAVGTVVGQMGKILGCRVVGVAGGEKKCSYVKDELGFDECIDYKAGNIQENLAKACPDGIDIYFENVGGPVSKAVATLLNEGSRVPICGFISAYNSEDMTKEETPFHIFGAADPTPEHRFFVVTEWFKEWREATEELSQWISEGKIKYEETITEGFENAPQGLRDVLSGKNFGKQLIKVAEE
jgi:NADPH-dependent curcumin reductase CurA